MPVLTVVGELDGMTISYVYRSVKSKYFIAVKNPYIYTSLSENTRSLLLLRRP